MAAVCWSFFVCLKLTAFAPSVGQRGWRRPLTSVPACCAHTIVCHDSYTPLYINSTIHASLLAAVGAYKLVRQYITGSTRPAIADGDVTPTTPSSGAASAASALTPTTPTRKPWLSSVASYLDKHVTCRNVLLVSLGCTSTATPPLPTPSQLWRDWPRA